jgi:hypothetical protein
MPLLEASGLALSALTPATRRRILKDLGIDVWRLRSAAPVAPLAPMPEPAAPAPRPAAVSPAEAPPVTAPSPVETPRVKAPRVEAARHRAAASAVAAPAAPEPIERLAEPAAPLSVLSLAAGSVVMLLEGSPPRRDLRLARDVLAAAGGDWRAKPVTRRFDWPPAVAGAMLADGPDALRRALEAFVRKDLDDYGARLLLCQESLCAHLPEQWPGCGLVVLPPLGRLGREPAQKRQLWRDIARAAGSAGPPTGGPAA